MRERPNKRRGPMTILRESRKARQYLILAVVLCVLYPLSAGPVIWAWIHLGRPVWAHSILMVVYWPMRCVYYSGPTPIREAYVWYTDSWKF